MFFSYWRKVAGLAFKDAGAALVAEFSGLTILVFLIQQADDLLANGASGIWPEAQGAWPYVKALLIALLILFVIQMVRVPPALDAEHERTIGKLRAQGAKRDNPIAQLLFSAYDLRVQAAADTFRERVRKTTYRAAQAFSEQAFRLIETRAPHLLPRILDVLHSKKMQYSTETAQRGFRNEKVSILAVLDRYIEILEGMKQPTDESEPEGGE